MCARISQESRSLDGRPPAIRSRAPLRGAPFCLALFVVLTAISPRASAMFVASSEKELPKSGSSEEPPPTQPSPSHPTQPKPDAPPTTPETEPGPTEGAEASDAVAPEDLKLTEQIRDITVSPPPTRKVNSNTFARMSGEKDKFKPVLVSGSEGEAQGVSASATEDLSGPQERIFALGSWVFVISCVGAAAIALLRIRRQTSPH